MSTSPVTLDPRIQALLSNRAPVDTVDAPALTNTIASRNPLISNFISQDDAKAPALGTNIAMPSSAPSIGMSLAPRVSQAPPTQTQMDTTELNRRVNSGDGISQINNPLLRGIARTADVLGSVFAPNLAMAIPGTMLHHDMLVGQQDARVKQDEAQTQAAAQTGQTQAETRHLNDESTGLEAPKGPEYDYVDGPNGKVAILKGSTSATPVTVNGQPLSAPIKPKTIEEQAYDFALKSGKNPLDAYSAVYGAKNVKDAGLPQQYLDAISSGDTTKAKLIKQVINDTSTQPHIQVINAAAADRASATATKTAPLDTSDPAMQASVAGVANGSLKLSDVFGRGATTAQKAQFAAAVKQVNPNYNSGDHDIENAVRRDFTSGHDSNTLNAVNTAYKHLDTFAEAAKALNNGNLKSMNEFANALGVQVQNGASPQVVSGLVKEALKGEVARALTGAGATVDEQRNIDSSFSNANSLPTMLAVANEAKTLLKGKQDTLKTKFDTGQSGKPNFIGDNAPAEGATKTNSHGDPIAFRNGKWGPA